MKDTAKYIYAGICLLVVFVLIKWGLPYAFGTGVCLWPLSEMLMRQMRKTARRKMLYERVENFYVVGLHPDSGEVIELPRHKGKYIIEKHSRVMAAAAALRKELEDAGNDKGKVRPDKTRKPVEVITYIFGWGEHARETWEEYLMRVDEDMTKQARAQNTAEEKNDPAWYAKNMVGQRTDTDLFEWPGRKLKTG